MAKFQVGQEIVCINTIITTANFYMPLIKGKIYTVLAVRYCQSCGSQSVDVGYKYNITGTVGNFTCRECKYNLYRAYCGDTTFHASGRFRSLEEMTCTSEEIEELLNSSVMTK